MNRTLRALATLAVSLKASASVSSAAPTLFTVDPAQSVLHINPKAAFGAIVIPLSMQGPGSWTANYSGSIAADVTATTIQILPATEIIAGNSGNWKPGDVYPTTGRAENDPVYLATAVAGNYGNVSDYTGLNGPAVSNSAIRDVKLRLADSAPKALSGGDNATFSEAGIQPGFISGTVYYGYGSAMPTGPITNLAGLGVAVNPLVDAPGTGTLTKNGNLMRLTIPVSFNTTYSLANVTYSGLIVATATVPEPASAAALLSALPMLTVARRVGRKFRGC